MKLFTKQWMIDNVSARWKGQYWTKNGWAYPDKQGVYDRLVALTNPTEQDVVDAIGNKSWTRLTCDECKREVDAIVQVGQEPDYESATAYLCLDCLKMALALIEDKVAE